MSLSNNVNIRRRLGDKFQLRRSVSRDMDAELNQSTSTYDGDSSFASTSTGGETSTRAKVGGLGALGVKVRSLSSGAKKISSASSGAATKSTFATSLPRTNQSKSSLFDDTNKNKRNSRLFDALGFKQKPDLPLQASSSTTSQADENTLVDSVPQSSTPRPRLSISGLSGHLSRRSSYFSLDTTTSTSKLVADEGTSPGEFNLRSFRNVRGQDSTSSFAFPNGSTSPIPMSLYNQHLTRATMNSRQDSFVSADDSTSFPAAASPTSEGRSPSVEPSRLELPAVESKQSSPRSDVPRSHGGSISAGRFRKVTANTLRHFEEIAGSSPTGGSFPFSESTPKSTRPSSPFNGLTSSPSETLAALEAEMLKGRTTPLMYWYQNDDPRAKSLNAVSPVEVSRDHYAAPKLPWMRDEADNSRKRRSGSSTTAYNHSNGLHGDASKVFFIDGGPVGSNGELEMPKATTTLDTQIFTDSKAHPTLTSSPTEESENYFSQSRAFFAPSKSPNPQANSTLSDPKQSKGGDHGWSMFNQMNGIRNGTHRRAETTTLDYIIPKVTNMSNHQRSSSAVPYQSGNNRTKVNDLWSFHNQQAPLLAAAQSRIEIQPQKTARIAWPAPPCVKLDYFSQLTALHQHSLYEQHRKAAEHALAEYLRLMEGVVPKEAMTRPGHLFADTRFLSNVNGRADYPSRSRSISVPGRHGSNVSSHRRRSSVGGNTKSEEPVPPLPSDDMLEKMEERAQSRRNSTVTLDRGRPPSSNGHHANGRSNSTSKSLSRMPSAKFMTPKHSTQFPIEALDGGAGDLHAETKNAEIEGIHQLSLA